jgi:hypothetical protein
MIRKACCRASSGVHALIALIEIENQRLVSAVNPVTNKDSTLAGK